MSRKTCGDYGGEKRGGGPCGHPAGLGTDHLGRGRCVHHPDDPAKKPLSTRERRFVDRYCFHGNGARAIREISGRAANGQQRAYEVLHRPHVQAAIDRRLQKASMSALEAQARLSEWARGSVEPFVTEDGRIDLSTDLARDHLHLIKKVKQTERTVNKGDEDVLIRRTELELHDPKDATVQVAKIHGLYRPDVLVGEDGEGGLLIRVTSADGSAA